MVDMTFITKEQVEGNKQLNIFKTEGTTGALTDFSILLGAFPSTYASKKEGKSIGSYLTKSEPSPNNFVFEVSPAGDTCLTTFTKRNHGIRPVIKYSSISSSCSNKKKNVSGVLEVQYGEYPQTVETQDISEILESKFNMLDLSKTGAKYTIDGVESYNEQDSFQPKIIEEYEYHGQKYIRFLSTINGEGKHFSDGRKISTANPYWIKVEPIEWLVDERTGVAITKNIILSGLQYKNMVESYKIKFSESNIKNFMNQYLSKEIVQNREKISENIDTQFEDSKKILHNPYDLEYKKVSEEDIIRGAIESNVAVFLHGRSSDGKSARVKQIDPDCTIVYLRNATPDSLNGKSVYDEKTGEMIDVPPSWYKKVKEKCEAEPNKLHIVFFDELTNSLPSIQGMAFNIILDKEVNGTWKLPDNARVVAAGNDMDDSLAANEMAEPLFNRFAHVYINTTIDTWLKWAAKKESNIHPAIYAYMSYQNQMEQGNATLRTQFNGKQPNADPRKWEMASKVLYATGKPAMLKGLIGIELTNSFCEFCSQQVVTIHKVINDSKIKKLATHMDEKEKFATVLNLSKCDEKDLKVVREFVKELGSYKLSVFDVLWSKGETKRLEKIAKLRLEENTRR